MSNEIFLLGESHTDNPIPSVINSECEKKYGDFNNVTVLNHLLERINGIIDSTKGQNMGSIGSFMNIYNPDLHEFYEGMTDKNKKKYNKIYKKLILKEKPDDGEAPGSATRAEAIRIKKILEKIKAECIESPRNITLRDPGNTSSAGRKRKKNGSRKNKKRKSRGKHLKKKTKRH